jgi:hypothetical protein
MFEKILIANRGTTRRAFVLNANRQVGDSIFPACCGED